MATSRVSGASEFLWVEQGERAIGPVATVAPIAPIDRSYVFRVPDALSDKLTAGQRVMVPMGKRRKLMPAFCISVDERPWDNTLSEIDSVIDQESFITPELLELGRWISAYYACPLGRALKAMVPEAVRKQAGYQVVYKVHALATADSIEADGHRLGPKQKAILERLAGERTGLDLRRLLADTGAGRATLRILEARKWVRIDRSREPQPPPDFDLPQDEPEFELNADQRAADQTLSEVIDAGRFCVTLLFGVSGSGKTEVYIRAMRRVLAQGKQAIMLVPEIALTTQLVQRLASRFTNVAVIHSGLTGVHRSLTWTAIRNGQKPVVIGTRSAVFAPCPNLGLIVVDEEQEPSYKNLQAPRFHVRDVAIKRAQNLSIPVLLGSATPSLESWANCERLAHYRRIELPKRVRELPMPSVTVVDMNDEYSESTGVPLLSHVLVRRLGSALSQKQQAVILMNRRGFANWIVCRTCRYRITCPNCNVNMVFHASRGEVVCHYCGRRDRAPKVCPDPSCGGPMIKLGSGTERVVDRLQKLFPDARIARVDSDTMRHARTYRRLVEDFENREIDCLVGTQMVAKGLDFPFVSFVGVIGADAPLGMPDFRSGERLFQMVTQVAGRAGRSDVPGDVVVQTVDPTTPALRAAVDHDYPTFVRAELTVRRQTRMPPFTRLARIVVADADEQRARDGAGALTDNARTVIAESGIAGADVLGPMPCVLPRLRNRYRYELLLRCETSGTLQRLLDELRAAKLLSVKASSLIIDVDPVSLS